MHWRRKLKIPFPSILEERRQWHSGNASENALKMHRKKRKNVEKPLKNIKGKINFN